MLRIRVMAPLAVLLLAACGTTGRAGPPGTAASPSSAPFDLVACDTKGDCGSAVLVPATARVGDAVTIVVSGFFPAVTTAWCPDFGVAFDYAPPMSPGGGFQTAPAQIVDASHAAFRVPQLPTGGHTVTFICGRDAAFAHPPIDSRLDVVPSPTPSVLP
jgi:hypothetical protein